MSNEPKTARGIARKILTEDGRTDSQFVRDLKASEKNIIRASKHKPLW